MHHRSALWGFSERFKFPAAAQRPLQDFDRECLVGLQVKILQVAGSNPVGSASFPIRSGP
jgi:hypothetical protein